MKKINYKGSTLIETIIYIFILTAFLLIITQSFISILDVGKESQSASGIEADARLIMTRLSYDLSNSDNIITPADIGEQTNNLSILSGTNVITYSLVTGNLILDDDSGNDRLNSYDTQVSGLSFQRIGNAGGKNLIKTNFTLISNISQSGGQESKNYEIITGTR